MRFIDPKTDLAFKKIFGSDRGHAILISFLNNLIYNGDAIVSELEILNPYQPPPIAGTCDIELIFVELPKFILSLE